MTSRHRDAEQVVLETLVADAPLTARDIATGTDAHPLTIETACDRLQRKGEICAIGGAQYEISPTGKAKMTAGTDQGTE